MKHLATKKKKTVRKQLCVDRWKRCVEIARVINNCNLIDSIPSEHETKGEGETSQSKKIPRWMGFT